MVTMVDLTCSNCGKMFSRRKAEVDSAIKKGRTVSYCGISCARSKKILNPKPLAVPEGQKFCLHCAQTKNIEDFHSYPNSKDGKHWHCKSCRNASAVKYRETYTRVPRPADQVRRYNMAKYGITVEQYDDMVMAQCGLCAVCGNPEIGISKAGEAKKLAVHHSHKTGKAIALCCSECNLGMGKLKDSAALLRRAADLMDEEVEL